MGHTTWSAAVTREEGTSMLKHLPSRKKMMALAAALPLLVATGCTESDSADNKAAASEAVDNAPEGTFDENKAAGEPVLIGLDSSAERRVGNACVSTCNSRLSPCHYKKN